MSRSSGYSQEEDKLLCQVYIEISQDPIVGVYQSADQFWNRAVDAYDNAKKPTWGERTKKSIQCRMQTIEKAAKKLHACIKQCENRRSSGASNSDIFEQAKSLLSEDTKFKTGWKFEHVWSIVKNFEKFQDGVDPPKHISIPCGFESENGTFHSPTQTSPGLSSFPLNLDDDENFGRSPSQRPSGIKKSKMKRKLEDQTSSVIKTLQEGNKQFLEQLNKTHSQRQHHLHIQEQKEENKILFYDLNMVQDPNVRAYFQSEQARILQKRRGQQQDQEAPPPTNSFGEYFNDIGGSGSSLPEY